MTNGYNFYFGIGSEVLTFPITPGELTISVGSKNSVITLIDEGDINILKSPSLTEISFEARFPMRDYPYSRKPSDFKTYYDKFKKLKENRQSFKFIVARMTPGGKRLWDTNLTVALESFEIKESADEGDDVLIEFKLKQYRSYGVKTLPNSYLKKTTSTASQPRETETVEKKPKPYIVQKGDSLYSIAKKVYGDGSKYKEVYFANENEIEKAAKNHGKASSSNGNLIYPGTVIVCPVGTNKTNTMVQLGSGANVK